MTESNDRSRVLTLVFTDLADSTTLKTARGDQAMRDLIRQHEKRITRLSAESIGRIINWTGGGCFPTFEMSSAQVVFALRLRQAHAEESELPGVRVGVHMGRRSIRSTAIPAYCVVTRVRQHYRVGVQ